MEPPRSLEPFLKWPGGKRYLAYRLTGLMPTAFGRYFEPFLGSGAIYFALAPKAAVLGDHNEELVDCFEQVKDNCEEVVAHLRTMPNTEADYYRIRASDPSSPSERAARLIYLVKLAFNGIYRVNGHTGRFNVPYGQHPDRVILDPENLLAASKALTAAVFRRGDFETTVEDAIKGDVVYFDPPYTVAHNSNGFVRYNTALFTWADQERLATLATRLVSRGCYVVVSNACHKSLRPLYEGFQVRRIRRFSTMSADPDYRRRITENVFVGAPK